MTVLIGLNGYKGSGKNTAANFIDGWAQTHGLLTSEHAFADLLKLAAARSLGLVMATNINDAVVLMDSLKESGIIDITIPEQSLMKSITGREYLKWFGTEGHRDVFGTDFWVDLILPPRGWEEGFVNGDYLADIALVTDVRFANEARRVQNLGGEVWNIDRGLGPDEHASEQPLPKELVDLIIDNKTTFENLEANIRGAMDERHGELGKGV